MPTTNHELESENRCLKEANEHLKDALHRDQTGLAGALNEVARIASCARASFEYAIADRDSREKDLFDALQMIEESARDAVRASGNHAHRECCGRGNDPPPPLALTPPPDEEVRPDFASFASKLRKEAEWSVKLHAGDRTGQAASDQKSLMGLAHHVERVGRKLGFWP